MNLESFNMNFQPNSRSKFQLRRALYVVGLLLRHFDFTNPDVLGDLSVCFLYSLYTKFITVVFPQPDTKDQVYMNMMFFIQHNDVDLQVNTLKAIGNICIRHHEFMLEPELKEFYHRQLVMEDAPLQMKIDVLLNIENYLIEEENRMIQQDLECTSYLVFFKVVLIFLL